MVTIFVYQQKLKLQLHHTTGTITDKPMLDFKDAFTKGHNITFKDISTLMICKNIDFSHTNWMCIATSQYYNDVNLMTHLIDNMLDIYAVDSDKSSDYPFIIILLYYNNDTICLIDTLFNNAGVTYDFFDKIKSTRCTFGVYHECVNALRGHQKHIQLLKYLTDISLNKFAKYYNLVKYYDMTYTMLLIIKVQKKVPNTIIKHLIIPFVYQR